MKTGYELSTGIDQMIGWIMLAQNCANLAGERTGRVTGRIDKRIRTHLMGNLVKTVVHPELGFRTDIDPTDAEHLIGSRNECSAGTRAIMIG